MHVIRVRNVHDGLPVVLKELKEIGVERDSRNGSVVKFPEPTTIVYEKPCERVIRYAGRDANPYFHFMESMWMLAGRQDVEFLKQFVSTIGDYSDDGENFHAAYGHRWSHYFGFDQIDRVVEVLIKNPDDRRVVVQLWDAADLGQEGKDFACNTQVMFSIADDGRLDMMVTNRSNDIIWGALGANAVHFSYLMEYVAHQIGVGVGVYRQVSNNMHAYTNVLKRTELEECRSFYNKGLKHYPLIINRDEAKEYSSFLDKTKGGGFDKYRDDVIMPLLKSHKCFKKGDYDGAVDYANKCRDLVWASACIEWLGRRKRIADDGVGGGE